MTRSIEQIRASGLCAGCGICASIAPAGSVVMEESEQGWLRPRVDRALGPDVLSTVNKVCPGIRIDEPTREADGALHSIWGPVADLRFAWATDPDLRYVGSSGGGLSAMLAYLIDTGDVDYVVATAMSGQQPTRNETVFLSDVGGVMASAGSRYAPSAPLAEIDRLLEEDRRFAFVGKPCDVAALRQLARIDPRVDQKVVWMFAFFCAGLPSYKGTDALLLAMGVPDGAKIESFRFRGEGWPGYAKAVTADGHTYSMDYDTSWGSILSRYLQFRCKVCPDGIGEFADIAFADGWYCDENGQPLFDEADGRSLTVVRKSKAAKLFDAAIEAGYLGAESADLDAVPAMQPHQARRKGMVSSRLAAFALVGHIPPEFKGLSLRENSKGVPFKTKARNFLGTLRRLVRQRTEK